MPVKLHAYVTDVCHHLKRLPPKTWMRGGLLFFTPICMGVLCHVFKPTTIVHVSMDILIKKYAVHKAQTQKGSLDEAISQKHAHAFKGCVARLAHQKRWIMTDRRGCWGDPQMLAKIRDVTDVVEKVCCGGDQ